MAPNFLNAISLFWICVQYFRYEMSTVLRQELWKLIVTSQDLLVKIGSFGVLKWQEATDHCIQYNTTAPDIRLQSSVPLASNHLRCSIAWRPTGSLQLLCTPGCIHVTQAKVNDFQCLIVVKEKILGLQISVADSTLVDVLDTTNKLLIHPHSCFFM